VSAAARCRATLRPVGRFFGSQFLGGFEVAFILAEAGDVALSPRPDGAPPAPRRDTRNCFFKTGLDGFFFS